MNNPSKKIEEIQKFIEEWIKNTKTRGKMYGDISQIEAQWWVLDFIYCMLEDLPDLNIVGLKADFNISKGFGTKNFTHVIKDANPENPYLELNKLRDEFEKYRDEKIKEMKKTLEK